MSDTTRLAEIENELTELMQRGWRLEQERERIQAKISGQMQDMIQREQEARSFLGTPFLRS